MVIPALKQMKITTEKTAGLIIKDIRPSTRDYIEEGKKILGGENPHAGNSSDT